MKLRDTAKEGTIGLKNRLVRFSPCTWLYKSAFSSFPGNQSKPLRRIENLVNFIFGETKKNIFSIDSTTQERF